MISGRIPILALLLVPPLLLPAVVAGQEAAVLVPAGTFTPQYAPGGEVTVAPFELDASPVTVGDFLTFLEAEPDWRRGRAPAVFAGPGYLSSWAGELDPGLEGPELDRPVTEVSWFAARAYCSWRDARLPTTDEWELAARASRTEVDAFRDPDFNRELLGLFQARPEPHDLPPVGRTFQNVHGVWDLHGLVWEWTADFNNQMLTGSGRGDQGLDRGLFCASGSVGANDRSDYVAFLRYSFRSSLTGPDAGPNLGFRCAATPPDTPDLTP